MANVSCASITFHSKSKSEIEWLKEKLEQAKGFVTWKEEPRIRISYLADFFDLSELTFKHNELDGRYIINEINEIRPLKDEWILEIETENPWNPCFSFWDDFSEAIRIEYAMFYDVEFDYSILHDPKGIYYETSCEIDYWEDDSKYFNNVTDMVAYLKKHHPTLVPDNADDTDEWDENLRDEDIGAVRVYARESA